MINVMQDAYAADFSSWIAIHTISLSVSSHTPAMLHPLAQVVLAYSHTNEDVLKVTSKAARDYGVELRYEPVSPPVSSEEMRCRLSCCFVSFCLGR